MNPIEKLLSLYKNRTIFDGMDESQLNQFFKSHGIPAYKHFLSLISKHKRISVDDKKIEGLVNILNLLNCKTTASCSGYNNQMAFINFAVNNLEDFNCIDKVLTNWSDGQLDEFFENRYKVSTLPNGIRVDLDCKEDELDEFGAWLFFCSVQNIKLGLDWQWQDKKINHILQKMN